MHTRSNLVFMKFFKNYFLSIGLYNYRLSLCIDFTRDSITARNGIAEHNMIFVKKLYKKPIYSNKNSTFMHNINCLAHIVWSQNFNSRIGKIVNSRYLKNLEERNGAAFLAAGASSRNLTAYSRSKTNVFFFKFKNQFFNKKNILICLQVLSRRGLKIKYLNFLNTSAKLFFFNCFFYNDFDYLYFKGGCDSGQYDVIDIFTQILQVLMCLLNSIFVIELKKKSKKKKSRKKKSRKKVKYLLSYKFLTPKKRSKNVLKNIIFYANSFKYYSYSKRLSFSFFKTFFYLKKSYLYTKKVNIYKKFLQVLANK